MMKYVRIFATILIYFLLRFFNMYVLLHMCVLLMALFLKFVLKENNVDIQGHTIICAALAAFNALNTIYLVEGKRIRILSKEFGIELYGREKEIN